MASFKFDPTRDSARIYWRFDGRQVTRTIKGSERDAERAVAQIEETLQDLARGRIKIPPEADPDTFVFSGGRVLGKAAPSIPPTVWTLTNLVTLWQTNPPVHLEASTRKMTLIHFRRLTEILGAKPIAEFDARAAQAYVAARAATLYRGTPIGRDTITKELDTLRGAWKWVAGITPGFPPVPDWTVNGLSLPKGKAIRPFMTWAEIERLVERGRLEGAEADELWDNLWLDRQQVRELLADTARARVHPYLHPMMAAAAFTGARRSELCRSEISDWDLEDGRVALRQKKRDRDREFSFRQVPIHPDLAAIIRAWLEIHPGGTMMFASPQGRPVAWGKATWMFTTAVAGGRWKVVRGWHVLRHSFASNLAALGVDQRLIDSWMGHSTSIRLRYQHLRPKDQADAVRGL